MSTSGKNFVNGTKDGFIFIFISSYFSGVLTNWFDVTTSSKQTRRREEPELETMEKLKLFFVVHWRGVVCVVVPLLAIVTLLPLPPEKYQWCAYCLMVMAIFWVTECIPLPVTSFVPVIVFPLAGVLNTTDTCKAYMNDTLLMFIGSIMLAYSVEQSGLHKRLAYCAIRLIGYSHYRLLAAMCLVTMFISMWLTNTAAATMMVPINFAVLGVFENYRLLKIYDTSADGEKIASDITCCYFCVAAYSATIGGIGTLVGTATNLACKGQFVSMFPTAPELLSFPKFSMYALPLMVIDMLFMYLYMIVVFFGFLRPQSDAAKQAKMTPEGIAAAKKAVGDDWAKLGPITFWEIMVIILFGGAMVLFFFRSPQMFTGWGDFIEQYFGKENRFVLDSALAGITLFLMMLLPANLSFFSNFSAKFQEDLPKKRVRAVLDWTDMIASMPFSFAFLLGGGFALSAAAKKTGLNEKLGEALKNLENFPDILVLLLIIVVVILFTNFASNVAVVNVFSPIAMQLAKQLNKNPLMYTLASGLCASFCFMLPVGTPGNLIVQSAANIPTKKMVIAGAGPTVTVILSTWLGTYYWGPVVWDDLNTKPDWAARMRV